MFFQVGSKLHGVFLDPFSFWRALGVLAKCAPSAGLQPGGGVCFREEL